MAGENGEGCGDDLNVLGLQVTLRFFWSSSIKRAARAYPMLYLC